ncbi:uncharacterized protein C8orf74 homolog [Microcaecilia unicolor]|uniref:Uncharacterized protein C8orf74 homolog n=1 Tax=Microcaecilia unicolor TaxID=1415580 RepID=A0A6P7X775_9AMPH|nr:uncharacterized protein C8orf74 homolog [Microcaecilia unicolor]
MASWLSTAVVQKVVELQKEAGRQFLRVSLRRDEFDEDGDLKQSILLDLLHESLIFAAQKGFPWSGVALVGKFTEELMNQCKGLSVSEAIILLKDKLKAYESQLTHQQLLTLFDYFNNTFFRNYQLYQFVLCQDQKLDRTLINLEIQAPLHPLPLTKGIDVNLYNYQQKLAELSAAEAEKRTSLLHLKEKLCLKCEKMLEQVYKDLGVQDTQILDNKLFKNVVKEVIGTQIKAAEAILKEEIRINFEILELRLQKKILKPPTPYPPSPPRSTSPKGERSKSSKKLSKSKSEKMKKKS